MKLDEKITRVCGRCGCQCVPRVGQFVFDKERHSDGQVFVNRIDDVVVSDCCGATYTIYIGEQEVGTGSEGVDELTAVENFQ